MRADRRMTRVVGGVVLGLWCSLGLVAQAGQGPAAAAQVPDGVAFALLVDRPGEAVGACLDLLDRFKGINPELGRERLGQEVVQELGDNILTPEGMRAFGLDPEGGGAVFGQDLEGEPEVLLPLSDSDVFIAKMTAVAQKGGQTITALPKPVAGAKLFKNGSNFLAVSPRQALMLSGLDSEDQAVKRTLAVLGGGKKLAAGKAFQKALAGLQPGAHAVLYMDFARVGKGALAELDQSIQAEQKYVAGLPAEQKKARQADVARMQAVRKKFAALLGKFDVFGWSLRLEPRTVGSSMLLGALPAGQKLLQAAFPAGGPTAFHAALAGHSLWSGWLSLRLAGFLELVADLPDGSYRTLGDGLADADREFKQEMGLSLLKDVFGNLKEPLGFYFLSPDLSGMKADEPMQQQILRLFKVACVARVADAARLDALIAKVTEKATAAGQPPEAVELDGAKLQVFRPEPGLVFALGRKGDAALLGFGQDALSELARAMVPGGLAGAAQGDLRGVGRVDVAAVSELLSAAVAKNIGGQEGMGFRMLWPMVQQVLGQVASLELEGRLPAGGLQARWTLNFR